MYGKKKYNQNINFSFWGEIPSFGELIELQYIHNSYNYNALIAEYHHGKNSGEFAGDSGKRAIVSITICFVFICDEKRSMIDIVIVNGIVVLVLTKQE